MGTNKLEEIVDTTKKLIASIDPALSVMHSLKSESETWIKDIESVVAAVENNKNKMKNPELTKAELVSEIIGGITGRMLGLEMLKIARDLNRMAWEWWREERIREEEARRERR